MPVVFGTPRLAIAAIVGLAASTSIVCCGGIASDLETSALGAATGGRPESSSLPGQEGGQLETPVPSSD